VLQNPALLQFLVIAAYNLFSLSYWLICFREKAMVVGLILFDRLFFRELFCFYIKSKALIFPTNKKKKLSFSVYGWAIVPPDHPQATPLNAIVYSD